MTRTFLTLALATCTFLFTLTLAADAYAARKAQVKLKSGRTLVGEVVEQDAASITLSINNIKTRIPLTDIEVNGIEFLKTAEEEYKDRRAKLKDTDIKGRLGLAQWLYEEKAFALAKLELDDLITRDPTNDSVKILRAVVIEKIKQSGDTTPTPVTPDKPRPDDKPAGTDEAAGDLPTKMLEQKHINKIRVMEIDFEAKPRVVVPRDVLEKFVEQYADDSAMPRGRDLARFKSPTNGSEQLQLIFKLKAREYYDQVIIRDDPPALRDWRVIHRAFIQSSCATTECHGGAGAGRFFLFSRAPNREETIYTNFYIINEYQNDQGLMIDRDKPEESLLLHYGLPRTQTNRPHPDVPGFDAPFVGGKRDRSYAMVLKWLPMLYQFNKSYEIDYTIPKLAAKPKPEPAASPQGAGEQPKQGSP